ncbi:hypothetical protein N5P37_006409 [Trichoderma harzianum]|nr:hypothetical protein N5P37_006409 [Trichoderma harzianum]
MLLATDNTGAVSIPETDPISLTKTEGTEGQGLIKTHRNTLGLVTKPSRILYDGIGRLREQKDALGRLTKFECDGFDRVTRTTWPDSREVTTLYSAQTASAWPESVSIDGLVVGEQSFDGLGRVKRKNVGERTTTQTYLGNASEPSQVTTHKGDQSSFAYEPALGYALTGVTGDDATDAYEYDPKSDIARVLKSAYSTQDLKHFPSRFLENENIRLNEGGAFSTAYNHSMASKLQAYTDVNGPRHVVEYDSFGRMKQFSQGKLEVSFFYDEVNRLSEIQVHDEGGGSSSITTRLAYDDFGRETERIVLQATRALYRLSQSYGRTSLVETRHLEDDKGKLLRDETFEYDENNRPVNYTCQGNLSPTDEHGRQLKSQRFTFDAYDNLVEAVTGFQDGSQNTASYSFSSRDPTQLTAVTNSNPELRPRIELEYNANGCLTRDEQGRSLEYNSRSPLMVVRDMGGDIISQYHYDTAGRLVCQSVPGQADHHLFYRDKKLIASRTGDRKLSYLCDGEGYLGQFIQDGDGSTQTQLWSSNGYGSVLAWIDGQQPDRVHHQQYTPYGSGNIGTSIGFNGQWRDPVTGWYHLGNGYRVYNPVLMRFHPPDSWSPFTSGEINPCAYCLGDPVTCVDPSGHWRFLKKIGAWFKRSWKMVVGAIIAVTASIVVGVMTAGLSVAAQIGASTAAGAVVEAGWGAASNAIDGNPITFGSVFKDALVGGLAGVFTESGAVKSATKGAFQGLAFSNTAVALVMALATGSWPLFEEIAFVRSGNSGLGDIGSSTARDTIRPALKNSDSNDHSGFPMAEPGSTSFLSSGGGEAVADVLNLELRCVFLSARSSQYKRQDAGNSCLDILE